MRKVCPRCKRTLPSSAFVLVVKHAHNVRTKHVAGHADLCPMR